MDGTSRYDVVVIGGGTAGLSAALVLGRSRRRVLVLDGGEPRNAPASGVHGFFSRDGILPEELLRIGREQLEPYGGVEYRAVGATEVSGSDGSFGVTLEDGDEVLARKLVLATGIVDELPETPGFRELWGRGVYHCPYCHGWEIRDRPLAVLNSGEIAAEHTLLIRNWSRDLILLTDGPAGLEEEDLQRLRALGVGVNEKGIARLEGRNDGSEGLSRVVFEDGSTLAREGLFYGPPQRQRSGFAEALGCEVVAMGSAAEVVKADPMTWETSVPGVYAAGDAGSPPSPLQSVVLAAASGANAAAFLNKALCGEDAEAEASSIALRPNRS
ncbi:MAG: NAD(P)/FAD-dependent oxidoreductase [Rubrobacteraceae bacterium]